MTFSDLPRVKGQPCVFRIGEDLLERDSDGHVSRAFGYFSDNQKLHRELWAEKIMNELGVPQPKE